MTTDEFTGVSSLRFPLTRSLLKAMELEAFDYGRRGFYGPILPPPIHSVYVHNEDGRRVMLGIPSALIFKENA